MFTGILAGVFSALFMSISYICSRAYIQKYKDPVKLSVFSLLAMLFGGVLSLGISSFYVKIPFSSPKLLLPLLGEVVFFLIGQTSFFIVLKKVEASRGASFLGLKLIILAVIAASTGKALSSGQWVAVILCSLAATGMNLTGIRMDLKSLFWLFVSIFFYALCDLCLTGIMASLPPGNMMMKALAGMGVCYTAMGLAVLPFLYKYRPTKKEFLDVIPYSIFYFSSILLIMACFGLLGVVFGNIIQSGRGIISVLLGILFLRLGWEKTEKNVPAKVWAQRFIMAFLMLCAMSLYTLATKHS